jgi:hypothetical protein
LGDVFMSPPTVVSWGPNRFDIFGLGTDNQMYYKAWLGNRWYLLRLAEKPLVVFSRVRLLLSPEAQVAWISLD